MGVTVSRAALITNTKAVSQACGYEKGKVIVSLIDPKREVSTTFIYILIIIDNALQINWNPKGIEYYQARLGLENFNFA